MNLDSYFIQKLCCSVCVVCVYVHICVCACVYVGALDRYVCLGGALGRCVCTRAHMRVEVRERYRVPSSVILLTFFLRHDLSLDLTLTFSEAGWTEGSRDLSASAALSTGVTDTCC